MDISIIIVSYNTAKLLRKTVEAIQMEKNWEMIVVDNHSTDGTVEMIVANFPKIRLIKNSYNAGFSRANNQAIKIATGKALLLLNSDVVITNNAVKALWQYLINSINVGVVTPKILLPDGSMDKACHRGFPTIWRSWCYFIGLEKKWPKSRWFGGYHQAYLGEDTVHRIETTAATAMMIKKEVVDKVGLLDERFFMYAEDLDWCKRIRDLGYQIVFFPKAKAIHYKSQSGKNSTNPEEVKKTNSYFYQTMIQFYDKHYRSSYPFWVRWLVRWSVNLLKWWKK